jgi:hypothetical protein
MTIHNKPVLLVGSRHIPIPFLANPTLDTYDVTLHYITYDLLNYYQCMLDRAGKFPEVPAMSAMRFSSCMFSIAYF